MAAPRKAKARQVGRGAVKAKAKPRAAAKTVKAKIGAAIAAKPSAKVATGDAIAKVAARTKLPIVGKPPKGERTPNASGAKAKGRVSTERAVTAFAITDAPPTTTTLRRHATRDGGTTGAPANDAPTMSAAPLATIAPRGVFLPDRVVVDVEGDTFPRTTLDEHGRDEAILSGSAFDAVRHHALEGHRLVDGDPPAAFRAFRAAFGFLPEPVQNWNAAGWLLVAMGECAIRTSDFAAAIAPLKDAMHCPGTIGNPWVHLLLGRCRLELGDERAADELARAYMGGGRALFDGLDPKYFALVEHVLKPPPGHDRLP